jgi:hypothetical protein
LAANVFTRLGKLATALGVQTRMRGLKLYGRVNNSSWQWTPVQMEHNSGGISCH